MRIQTLAAMLGILGPAASGLTAAPISRNVADIGPEPCTLVTQADVEAAMGAGATITRSHNSRLGKDECRLKAPAGSAIGEIVIVVIPADSWDAVKKSMIDTGGKDVRGLGDDAFVLPGLSYNVRKGNKYVQVFSGGTDDTAANEKARRYLAEKASTRLH
jgi:hypothetical protein